MSDANWHCMTQALIRMNAMHSGEIAWDGGIYRLCIWIVRQHSIIICMHEKNQKS